MKQISDRVYCIALAALLHDIGKPLQRSNRSNKETLKTDGAKSMDRGDLVKYPHALWTSDFIFANQDIFVKLGPVKNYGFEQFQKLASKHHKPDNDKPDELILQAADWASAGFDRQNEKSSDYDDLGRDAYIIKPLVSLFTRVALDEQEYPVKFHRLGTLDSEATIPEGDVKLSTDQYHDLMRKFDIDFKKISTGNAAIFFDTLLSLITNYFWCVPSSTMEGYADIPLSDHSITTAAIASAMAICCEETGCTPGTSKYLLVAGDFAGIQKFIFALSGETNRNVAALLRGRSFMVNLYNVLCARMITDACGLPVCNTLTTAGGKFQILLPDTAEIRSILSKVKTKVEQWAFDNFFGELKLLITSGTPFQYTDFTLLKFQDVLNNATDSLNIEKMRPFTTILSKPEMWIDENRFTDFQANRICTICGKEPGSTVNDRTGENCSNYIEIGKRLRKYPFVVIKQVPDAKIFHNFDVEISEFNKANIGKIHSLYRINMQNMQNEDSLYWPELHYANYVPHAELEKDSDDDEAELLQCKSFENIAETAHGLKALAVLKADVDNMGLIFSQGFKTKDGQSKLSISRMVSMSRMLNWFFAGYMPAYICTNETFKNIYTLFAGGDDLCLIGPWDVIVDFADKIQKKFTSYTGNSPHITISAGLELFKPRFPVVHAVENAEFALEKSKQKDGKNSITVFGYTMKWDAEFESQIQFAKSWLIFIEKENASGNGNRNSMLYRFLKYHKNYIQERGKITALKHRFQIIYDLSRNIDRFWLTQEPFVSLLSTNVELTDLFKCLPVGISIATYKNREGETYAV